MQVSCAAHTVTFRVQQLGKPNAPVLTSVAPHSVRSGLERRRFRRWSSAACTKRAPAHQWDGRIEAVRVVRGLLPDEALTADPAKWTAPALVTWNAKAGPSDAARLGAAPRAAEAADPRKQALADLCHVLLNANEFFYLH